jgi:hypothetical protein
MKDFFGGEGFENAVAFAASLALGESTALWEGFLIPVNKNLSQPLDFDKGICYNNKARARKEKMRVGSKAKKGESYGIG